MYPNPLKQKLKAGELVLGTALPVFSSMVTTMTCRTGIDFLWIDTEHSSNDVESLDAIPVLARNQGVAPMVRVAWNDPHLIKKAYDIGAVAVMVPQVNTAEEAVRRTVRLLPTDWATRCLTGLAQHCRRRLESCYPHRQ
ncbi:MAG: aldolase/citrate lyase family protein [Caldilineaceae bacterium]